MADPTDPFKADATPSTSDNEVMLLRKIAKSLDILAGGAPSGDAASQQLTPAGSAVTSSGTVAAGKRSVTFIADSSFTGTVLGVALNASESITFTAPVGFTLGAIVYTRTAGTLRIFTV